MPRVWTVSNVDFGAKIFSELKITMLSWWIKQLCNVVPYDNFSDKKPFLTYSLLKY